MASHLTQHASTNLVVFEKLNSSHTYWVHQGEVTVHELFRMLAMYVIELRGKWPCAAREEAENSDR